MSNLTPTQRRMMALFSDGLPHTRREIHGCLFDDLAKLEAIKDHIGKLRKFLRPLGHDIVCELMDRRISYRHVVLLTSPCPCVAAAVAAATK